MDLHEYLAIALTLFYTASLLHLAGGFSAILKKKSRYSVHVLSVITVFLLTIFAYWSSWSYHTIEWTAWKFF
ncbi:MAG: hypothetical protein R8G66_03150 [Cytophagales bacterium]|nr:hypothetical protein [Cytophagales bacterium]